MSGHTSEPQRQHLAGHAKVPQTLPETELQPRTDQLVEVGQAERDDELARGSPLDLEPAASGQDLSKAPIDRAAVLQRAHSSTSMLKARMRVLFA